MSTISATQAFCYELDPTLEQERTLRFFCGVYRQVYNRYIEARRAWWEANKLADKADRTKPVTAQGMSLELTELMRANDARPVAERVRGLSAMRRVPRHLVTMALKTAHDAFDKWFARGKKGEWTKPPRFKSFFEPDDMAFAMQVQPLRWSERTIEFGKIGLVRTKEATSKMKGRPVRVTVAEQAGRWWVSVCCLEVPREVPERTDTGRVGVDLGVRKLATLSTGEMIIEPPEVAAGKARAEARIARLQRSLDRKRREAKKNGTWDRRKPSNGYRRVQQKLQAAHASLARARLDQTHKLTTKLVNEHRVVVIEDLAVKNMTASAAGTVDEPGRNVRAKSALNRKILDKCFGAIRAQLTYKAQWYGATVETVPRFYPSSKTCSRCGNVKIDLGSEETYFCYVCGTTIDRDMNAAINIRNFAPEAPGTLVGQPTGQRVDRRKARKGATPSKHVQQSEAIRPASPPEGAAPGQREEESTQGGCPVHQQAACAASESKTRKRAKAGAKRQALATASTEDR